MESSQFSPCGQSEAQVEIKNEPGFSSDRSTPASMRRSDTPITPVSQNVDKSGIDFPTAGPRDTPVSQMSSEMDEEGKASSSIRGMNAPNHKTSQHMSCNELHTRSNKQRVAEQVKIRVIAKTHEIKAAKDILEKFPDWLRSSEKIIPEVGDWLEDIQTIFQHADLPRVVLGFMGPSGCGKSSVINALLNEERLVPCNCLEACTAVVVEIAWNTSEEKSQAYRAEIEFVTKDEWKAELELLVPELLSLKINPTAHRLEPGSDAEVALAKIMTVYPDFTLENVTAESASQMMHDSEVSKLFGNKKAIVMDASKGKQFAVAIRPYIDSSLKSSTSGPTSHQKFAYWPLIKIVRIFTKSPVLNKGLVLVDLPGSGDSNLARENVAQDYMAELSAICVVASIERALTHAVTKDLFQRGASIKRQMFRNGLFEDRKTFFVLTHADIINTQEFIDGQGLENMPEISEILQRQQEIINREIKIQKEGKLLKNRVKQLTESTRQFMVEIESLRVKDSTSNRKSSKRKRGHAEMQSQAFDADPTVAKLQCTFYQEKSALADARQAMKKLSEEVQHLKEEKIALEIQLTAVCIQGRNSFVQSRMQADFSKCVADLGKEVYNDDGVETSSSRLFKSTTAEQVHTFCVCSKAYQKLKGRFPREGMPVGFRNFEDTCIPQLVKHCREFTLNAQENLADVFLEDLTRLRARMRGWADNTMPDKQITPRQSRLIFDRLTEQMTLLEEFMVANLLSTQTALEDSLMVLGPRHLRTVVALAAKRAPEVFLKWTANVHNVRTWIAICKKLGNPHRARGYNSATHTWNSDLAEKFTELCDKDLRKLVTDVLPALQADFVSKTESTISKMAISIKDESLAVTRGIGNGMDNFLHTFERLKIDMSRNLNNRFLIAIKMNRVVDRKIPPEIGIAMRNAYIEAGNETGTGTYAKSKTIIKHHLDFDAQKMYLKAGKKLTAAVEDTLFLLKSNLHKEYESYREKVEKNFSKMLQVASETIRPETSACKVQLQKEVLQKLSVFDTVLGEFQSKDGESLILEDPVDLTGMTDDEQDTDGAKNGNAEDDSINEDDLDCLGMDNSEDEEDDEDSTSDEDASSEEPIIPFPPPL